jgi:hypothetical protein
VQKIFIFKGALQSELPTDDHKPVIQKSLNNEIVKMSQDQSSSDLDNITYIECEASNDDDSSQQLTDNTSKSNGKNKKHIHDEEYVIII